MEDQQKLHTSACAPVSFKLTRKLLSDSDDFTLAQHDHGSRLEGWRQNVGGLVSRNVTASTSAERDVVQHSIVVLSWNVWIGHGQLREVVSRFRNGDFAAQGATPDAPLVVLAQEVYRNDASLPQGTSRFCGSAPAVRKGRVREDILETAEALGLNLRYAPSMRNRALQSDRGNAILSTLPLYEASAVELPHLLQRRVAVAATIAVGSHRLRVVCAHLDPRGPAGYQLLGGAGRAVQAQHLLEALGQGTVILGADLNIVRGRTEGTWQALQNAGFTTGVPPVLPTWSHTYHKLPRLVIDYLLVRDAARIVAGARVYRLDEHPLDRGPLVFGSDHHPLLARFDLTAPGDGQ